MTPECDQGEVSFRLDIGGAFFSDRWQRRYRKNKEPPKSGRVRIFIIFVLCMTDVYFCTQENKISLLAVFRSSVKKKNHFSWALLKIFTYIIRKKNHKNKGCANKFSQIRGNKFIIFLVLVNKNANYLRKREITSCRRPTVAHGCIVLQMVKLHILVII